MRKIRNSNNKKLLEEQFEVLIDVISLLKNENDLKYFLDSFLSESEKAYLSQRLNIMRMLSKHFSYVQIKEKINTSSATISNAKRSLDKGGDRLRSLMLSYKYKPKNNSSKNKTIKPFAKAHYPGAIKL